MRKPLEKELEEAKAELTQLRSQKNNYECILAHLGISPETQKEILQHLEDNCRPDDWDTM